MYRLTLVLGLKNDGNIIGGITVGRTLDDDITDAINPSQLTWLGNTKEMKEQILNNEAVMFRGVTLEQAFNELRKKFNSTLVNTNADIVIDIGTKSTTEILEFVPREVYMAAQDQAIIRHYKDKILNRFKHGKNLKVSN